ncbi:uncharacterized protein YALI1_A11010g [Yarrowia lipolytica]|uniref:Uncharacterized protein n=1 Tax=Yarrowia lipolytica TaxID=4952 RepID=A0A1D8N4E4_YARLL|nr:hypothetical protein YALI1_A11010g [Yarrowia lipolytica]
MVSEIVLERYLKLSLNVSIAFEREATSSPNVTVVRISWTLILPPYHTSFHNASFDTTLSTLRPCGAFETTAQPFPLCLSRLWHPDTGNDASARFPPSPGRHEVSQGIRSLGHQMAFDRTSVRYTLSSCVSH